jgi:hypothetical protein
MTTSVLTATPTPATRPVPWRRLGWVAWRRYRSTALSLAGLVGVLAVLLLLRGHQMRDAYATVQACTPRASASCRFAFERFHETYANTGPLAALFLWLPAVIGAFAGAPLLGRELESGTFRFAWTQGAGRTRWVIGLIVTGVLGVAVLSAGFGLLVDWYQQALFASGIQQRLHNSVFPVTGVAVVGWGVAAFSLGVFLGLLTRRVLAALAVTLAAWTGLAFLAASVLRDRYAAPLVASSLQLSPGDLPIDQWWTKGGVRATDAQINVVLQAIGMQSDGTGNFTVGPGSGTVDPIEYLTQHGFTQLTSYQPDSRYWTFQWIELGWLTVLSLLLLGASIWLIRRRPA